MSSYDFNKGRTLWKKFNKGVVANLRNTDLNEKREF